MTGGPNPIGALNELLQSQKWTDEERDKIYKTSQEGESLLNKVHVCRCEFEFKGRMIDGLARSTTKKREAKKKAAEQCLIKLLLFLKEGKPGIDPAKYGITEEQLIDASQLPQQSGRSTDHSNRQTDRSCSSSSNQHHANQDRLSARSVSLQLAPTTNGNSLNNGRPSSELSASSNQSRSPLRRLASEFNQGILQLNDFKTRKHAQQVPDTSNGQATNGRRTAREQSDSGSSSEESTSHTVTDGAASTNGSKTLKNQMDDIRRKMQGDSSSERSASPIRVADSFSYMRENLIVLNELFAEASKKESQQSDENIYTPLIDRLCKRLPELKASYSIQYEDSKSAACATLSFRNVGIWSFNSIGNSTEDVLKSTSHKLFVAIRLQFKQC